ncbi:MAG: hypothetical protein WCC97_12050 [Candidatus Acidiferrales bacterium]
MKYRAKDPPRVRDKIREARFFLEQTETHVEQHDSEQFMVCLSAFLTAFRSILYRMYGVAREQGGCAGFAAAEAQLKAHPDIVFLKDRTDFEVHGDAPIVWPRFTLEYIRSTHMHYDERRWLSKPKSRFESRFSPKTNSPSSRHKVEFWYFDGRYTDLIELCRNSLDDCEIVAKEWIG